jgi:predicted esterase
MANFIRTSVLQILFAGVFSISLLNYAQGQVQSARSKQLTPNSLGFYEYLPEGYGSGTQSYPLIIFCHGLGELGNGTTQLSRVLNGGLPRLINDGKFPKSFNVNGQTHRFIVISPQFVKWPTPADINSILDYAITNYRVDQTRVYITGLSMGGGITWEYAGHTNLYNKRLAAIVPIAGASWPDKGRAYRIADENLPVWATHNSDDPTVPVSYTNDYMTNIKTRNPAAPVKKTIFSSSSHDAWTTTYDPGFKENNMNIYEWMLQYKKGTALPTNLAPLANAGSDLTLTLPNNSAGLDGTRSSDPDGTIASYSWSKVSGPTEFTINDASSSKPTISNLVKGSYLLRLKITDNKGATATDDISVVVNDANKPPIVAAGQDITITLPTSSVSLAGTFSDPDGTIITSVWTKTSGPAQSTITSPGNKSTTVTGLVAGVYLFRLTATDNSNATAWDEVRVTVNASTPANTAPVVTAGSNVSITLPVNNVTLQGSAKDNDGTLTYIRWSLMAGASTASITTPGNPVTTVTNLTSGTYTFELKATDDDGASSTATAQVIVNAAQGGGGSSTFIKVNLIGNSDAYPNSEWNNWDVVTSTNTGPSVNIQSGKLNYSTGTASNISASLTHSQTVVLNAPYSGGMAPAEVLNTVSYSSTNRVLKLTGLTANKYYDLELYSSRKNGSNSTQFVVGNQTQLIDGNNNFNNKAQFQNLQANSNGELSVAINRVSTFNYLNGFMLSEKSSTTGTLNTASVSQKATISQADLTSERAGSGNLEISPNPVTSSFQLQFRNIHLGATKIQIVDINGRIVENFNVTKDRQLFSQRFNFPAKSGSGQYFVRVQVGDWIQVKKITRL